MSVRQRMLRIIVYNSRVEESNLPVESMLDRVAAVRMVGYVDDVHCWCCKTCDGLVYVWVRLY